MYIISLAISLALIVVGLPTDANTVPALTYLESTLMKNGGVGSIMVNQAPDLPPRDTDHRSRQSQSVHV